VFVQLGVNLSPTHWVLNNFEVIRYIGFRHWVPKIIVPVNANNRGVLDHNEPEEDDSLRGDLLECCSQLRMARKEGLGQHLVYNLSLAELSVLAIANKVV